MADYIYKTTNKRGVSWYDPDRELFLNLYGDKVSKVSVSREGVWQWIIQNNIRGSTCLASVEEFDLVAGSNS